ncbi:hypothetical protein JCM10908_001755 [Rhodotorula pacifica]|uniref:uncharacterized protein n=1 Tax=Rhodotorula pacifica TaxID=1495444 RepID=UPI00317CD88F
MDRSYGSSTSVLDTPTSRHAGLSASVLTKAQLAQSIGPSGPTTVQPLSFKPQNLPMNSSPGVGGGIVKSVRFSPAQQQQPHSPYGSGSTSIAGANSFSAAPSGRIQSFATPPRSYGSPSLLRTAAANSANKGTSAGGGGGHSSTPPRQVQQQSHSTGPASGSAPSQQQPGGMIVNQLRSHLPLVAATPQRVQSALAKSSTAVHAAQEGIQHAGAEAKKKLEVMPLGRGEAARRLRVNSVLLVAWWVSSRTTWYRSATGHLVAAVPQVDTPLHVGETLLLLVLCWNIIDALRLLNRLSSLPPSSTAAPLLAHSPALARSSSLPSLNSPARSSPKTRPTPSIFGSPSSPSGGGSPFRTAGGGSTSKSSPFRASALRGSDHPPTPQTPTSVLRGSPSLSVTRSANPSGDLGASAALAPSDEIKGALLAFEARHGEQYGSPSGKVSELVGGQSPASARIKVESREDVERLLE